MGVGHIRVESGAVPKKFDFAIAVGFGSLSYTPKTAAISHVKYKWVSNSQKQKWGKWMSADRQWLVSSNKPPNMNTRSIKKGKENFIKRLKIAREALK